MEKEKEDVKILEKMAVKMEKEKEDDRKRNEDVKIEKEVKIEEDDISARIKNIEKRFREELIAYNCYRCSNKKSPDKKDVC